MMGSEGVELVRGQRVVVANQVTQEKAWLEVYRLVGYKGCFIAYGALFKHALWLPAMGNSRPDVPLRRSCPVVDPQAPATLVQQFSNNLGGVPLVVMREWNADPAAGVPVLNIKRVRGWGKAGDTEDAYLDRAQRLVDLWVHWRREGHLLPAYTLARGEERYSRSNGH